MSRLARATGRRGPGPPKRTGHSGSCWPAAADRGSAAPSKRFGWDGRRLLDYPLEALQAAGLECAVVAKPDVVLTREDRVQPLPGRYAAASVIAN